MAKKLESMECFWCGKKFTPTYHNVVCCSEECKKKRLNAQDKARREKFNSKNKAPEKQKTNHEKIAEIAIEARKQGMSYGQYVAKYNV
jgi:hypothetical protein